MSRQSETHASPPGSAPRGCSRYSANPRRALSQHRYLYLGWILTYLLCLAYVAAARYFPEVTGKIVRCPLLTLTGIRCPSCGLTRAAMALLQGDWQGAAALNPLIFPVLGLTLIFPVVLLSDLLLGTRLLLLRLPRR